MCDAAASTAGRASAPPQCPLDGFAGHAARPQQHRLAEASDDGGFDADRRRAAVDNEIDPAAQIGKHMGRRRWRDVAGAVGRWRNDRLAEFLQKVLRHRVARHAHRDAVEARRRQLGHRAVRGLRQHERQRTRPERRREPFGVCIKTRQRPRRRGVGDVTNERIEGRPAFGGIEPRHGHGVGGVGTEPVDRLGRKRDQAAGRKTAHRLGDSGLIGGPNAGRERGCHCGTIVPK